MPIDEPRIDATEMAAGRSATGEAGQPIRNNSGLRGALGLRVLSQALDDVNSGFMTIIKNLPQLGPSFDRASGMATDDARELGAVADIAAATLDLLITRIGDWVASLERLGEAVERIRGPIEAGEFGSATTDDERHANPARSTVDAGGGEPEPSTSPQARRIEPIRERRDREVDRLARALQEGIGRDLPRERERPGTGLERDVRRRLGAAGMDENALDEAAAAVAGRLRENLEREGRERASNRPIDGHERHARIAEAGESARARSETDMSIKVSVILSGKEFLDRMRGASFARPKDDSISEAQLREQEKTNAKLDEIKEWIKKPKKGTYATFARGRP